MFQGVESEMICFQSLVTANTTANFIDVSSEQILSSKDLRKSRHVNAVAFVKLSNRKLFFFIDFLSPRSFGKMCHYDEIKIISFLSFLNPTGRYLTFANFVTSNSHFCCRKISFNFAKSRISLSLKIFFLT